MKIGIVCPYNIFKPGGVQQHVHHQTRLLRAHGHDVTIITPRPARRMEIAPEGVLFVGTSARVKTPFDTSPDVSMADDNNVMDILNEHNFDLLHIHEPMVPFMARTIAQKATCPKLGTFHAAKPDGAFGRSMVASYRTYGRSVVPYLNAVTAVSPAAVGDEIFAGQLPLTYVPNGAALDEYVPSKKVKRSDNMILFVGRLEKRKGCKMLIKAFEVLKQTKSDAKLVIVGDGPLRESLENYVRNQKIEDVEFVGAVDDEEKKTLLQEASVFSSPALYGESFGIVLVEAMSIGTPVVAHQNPGYEWVLQGTGRVGLVDAEDSRAYARQLALMMEDKQLRSIWQSWASEYVKQFSYEKVVAQYEKIYKEIIRK